MMTSNQATDYVIPSVRAYSRPAKEVTTKGSPSKSRSRRQEKPHGVLVIDMETTTDDAQRLLFGFYRYARTHDDSFDVVEEGIIYADELPSWRPDEYELLRAYSSVNAAETTRYPDRKYELRLRSRSEFVEQVLLPAFRNPRIWIAGLNLQFDLSRLATNWEAARNDYYGGFSFHFTDNQYAPVLRVKTLDSKRSLIGLYSPGDFIARKKGSQRTGRILPSRYAGFVDLRTLGFALTNRGHSLESACESFGIPGKSDPGNYGIITPQFVEYARNDVRRTGELYQAMMREYARHPISTPATKAFSPASIGKGYHQAMRIPPLSERCELPDWLHGAASAAYYGGRVGLPIRMQAVPVVYNDVMAMYTTVNALMDSWRYVVAETIDYEDATDDVQAMLDRITVDDCFDPSNWPSFLGLALIQPDDDMVPVRANYSAMWNGNVNDVAVGTSQIGVSRFTSERPYWYAIPDLVASKITTGKAPKIIRAIRFRPNGTLSDLRSVKLRGDITVDPHRDLFKQTIELRYRTRHDETIDPVERDRIVEFLKVFANATGYGIYAETIRKDRPNDSPVDVVVSDGQDTFETTTTSPETGGPYAFMPLAANITAGARLMLALMIHETEALGGTYAFTDTDSIAIVATENGKPSPNAPDIPTLAWTHVQQIVNRFALLNPYDPKTVPGSILKIEKENYSDDKQQTQVYCFGISSKRYVLYRIDDGKPEIEKYSEDGVLYQMLDGKPKVVKCSEDEILHRIDDGKPEIVKYSEHGLGHLRAPYGNDGRAWIKTFWELLLHQHLGLPYDEPDWFDLQATGQETITTPSLLKPFDRANQRRKRYRQIRPFNFMNVAYLQNSGLAYPNGADRDHFKLVHPFETDARKLARSSWINRYNGAPYKILTENANDPYALRLEDHAYVKSYRDVYNDWRQHAEYKYLDPNGKHPNQATGMLQTRNVTALIRPNLIGKEANKIEERTSWFTGKGEVTNVYQLGGHGTHGRTVDPVFSEIIVPVLKLISRKQLHKETGISVREIKYIRNGGMMPTREHCLVLEKRASEYALRECERLGIPLGNPRTRDGLVRCQLLLDHLAEQAVGRITRCVGCFQPLAENKERYCSNRCKMKVDRALLKILVFDPVSKPEEIQ